MTAAKRELTKILQRKFRKDQNFQEVFAVVKKNTTGKVWLVGGFIFRSLAETLYKVPAHKADFDFVVEKICLADLPEGWKVTKNRFDNVRLVSKVAQVDLIPLGYIGSIVKNSLEPSIENYLRGVPLTIQAIAYDFNQSEIIGEIGVKALFTRTVAVHNHTQAADYARELGINIQNLVIEKAKSLNFTPLT